MAWFKSSNTTKPAANITKSFRAKQNEQSLAQKKRARRRLMGALILAIATAIGLPMILDKEPKPLSSKLTIGIPSMDAQFPPPAASHEAPKNKKNSSDSAAQSNTPSSSTPLSSSH